MCSTIFHAADVTDTSKINCCLTTAGAIYVQLLNILLQLAETREIRITTVTHLL